MMPLSARERFLHALAYCPPVPADAVVILAGEDGMPRYQDGLEMFAKQAAPHIIVTGGVADDSHISGAQMRERLIGAGVHQDRISVDDACNTWKQAYNSLIEAVAKDWKRLLIVASPYHLPRAYLTFIRAAKTTEVQIVAAASTRSNIFAAPGGMGITRMQLLALEAQKIDEYQAKGHVATYEEGLEALRKLYAPK